MTATQVETARTPERAQFLADIVTTALEGGIGYWSVAHEYRWWSPTLDGGTCPHSDGVANAYAVIEDLEDPVPGETHRIDVDAVERALARFRQGPIKGLHEDNRAIVVKADRTLDEDGQLDADAADWIVQVACFGEVVYG